MSSEPLVWRFGPAPPSRSWPWHPAQAAANAPEEVEDTVEAGEGVFSSAGCAGCHGPDLTGTASGPDISTIGSGVITDFGDDFVTPSDTEQMIADFEEDPRLFLELWIRDSAGNYNGGEPTGMPPHTEEQINESQLRALITFLLAQTGE